MFNFVYLIFLISLLLSIQQYCDGYLRIINYAAESNQSVFCCNVSVYSLRTSASSYIMLRHYENKVVEPLATSMLPWADVSSPDALIMLRHISSQCPPPRRFRCPLQLPPDP